MKKLCVVAIIVALTAVQSFGLTFLGPPAVTLERGWSGLDLDYTFSQADLDVKVADGQRCLEDIELSAVFARLGYGINDHWECFVRLGGAVAEGSPIDSDIEFAGGIGTRTTLHKQENLRLGTLFQVQWFKHNGNLSFGGHSGDGEINTYEYQLAFGLTYGLNGFKLYGGPFLHSVGGDFDIKTPGQTHSFDFEEESQCGGYIGFTSEVGDYFDLCLEYQYTDDAHGVCIGTVRRF
jgi:hypothetical protein